MELHIQALNISNQTRIGIINRQFDDTFPSKIKQIQDSRWSPVFRCWHIPYTTIAWTQFKQIFDNELIINNVLINEKNKPIISISQNQILQQNPRNKEDLTKNTQEGIQRQQPLSDKIQVRLADFWKGYLRIDLPYRLDWLEKIKQIDGKQWHPKQKCWSLPHSPLNLDLLKNHFGGHLQIDLSPLPASIETFILKTPHKPMFETPPQYQDEVSRLIEKMILKRMSPSTIKTYKNGFTQFLHYYNDIHPKDITKEQIIAYMVHRIKVDKISESIQNNFINAIKCYYEFVLGRDRTYYDLQRPKRPFTLPNVLSQEEFIKLMSVVENVKHRCILLAIYSGGLRLSEVINLRKADIRKDDNSIFVKAGKGKKDRYTLLSQTLLDELSIYEQHYKTAYWLFEGETGGQYAARSVQYILRQAVEKSGVNPFATVHTLRHSFATHLVLAGHDILSVQKLLGHASPVTTEIYVHLTGEQVRRIQSPLDKLKL